MMQIDVNAIADKLNNNQRNTIMSLDWREYCILGCAEPVAIRLCKDTKRRPALVERVKGEEFWNFRLTAMGVAVQNALKKMAWGSRD